ncbi:MAG: glutathione S-transferase family protein [Bacillota bacterium]
MKLYFHPISTTCRPIMMFAADNAIAIDYQVVDLFAGEHAQPPYTAKNPSGLVPMLEEGDFRLTECSAILKYLADSIGSPAYPKDLKKRARVNERMDWLNTQFYRDWGYGLIYPQLFPNMKRPTDEQHSGVINWGKEKAKGWLKVLDEDLLGKNDYLCGNELTIADYMGAAYLTAGNLVGCNLAPYPNISRWLARMQSRPNWDKVNKPFSDLVESVKGKPFVAV